VRQIEANLAVLNGQGFERDGMLNRHVDETVHTMLCARVSNFGSISCNSEPVKYRRETDGDTSGPGWDALLRG
ncbi:MAG: hypothetical protein RLZZ327_621, partial [Actinomycetota bacterium]